MSLPIIFDGLDLNDGETYVVSNFTQSVGTRDMDLITIPGRDGAVVGQNTMRPTVFSFDIVIGGATVADRDANLRNLFGTTIGGVFHGVLSSESECELVITESDTSARHYQALPAGGEVTRFADGLTISGVTLTCPDPTYTDGETRTATGTESVTLEYEGNAETSLFITIEGTFSSDGHFGFEWESGGKTGVLTAAAPYGGFAATMTVDTGRRYASITIGQLPEPVAITPTLQTTWPDIEFGTVQIRRGTGIGTITAIAVEYVARWYG